MKQMNLYRTASANRNENVAVANLLKSIMVVSPLASIIYTDNNSLFVDYIKLIVKFSDHGLTLSCPSDNAPIPPNTLISWATNVKVPQLTLPAKPHADVLLGQLYVALHCPAAKSTIDTIHHSREIIIKTNLQHLSRTNLKRIIQWLHQHNDPAVQAKMSIFSTWLRFNSFLNRRVLSA
jgi:hypothetical protein